MSQIVPPLAAVLADFPDFRDPRGVRHPLMVRRCGVAPAATRRMRTC